MLLGYHWEYKTYIRTRNNKKHQLVRKHKVYELQCDSCSDIFMRTSKELHNKHGGHCCEKCNYHKFAQRQSIIVKQYNKLDASSGIKL
jgi:hypothetical protein